MVGTCLQRQNIALRTYAAFEKTTCMLLKGEKNLLQNGISSFAFRFSQSSGIALES